MLGAADAVGRGSSTVSNVVPVSSTTPSAGVHLAESEGTGEADMKGVYVVRENCEGVCMTLVFRLIIQL